MCYNSIHFELSILYCSLAQSVERVTVNHDVVSSSLTGAAISNTEAWRVYLRAFVFFQVCRLPFFTRHDCPILWQIPDHLKPFYACRIFSFRQRGGRGSLYFVKRQGFQSAAPGAFSRAFIGRRRRRQSKRWRENKKSAYRTRSLSYSNILLMEKEKVRKLPGNCRLLLPPKARGLSSWGRFPPQPRLLRGESPGGSGKTGPPAAG